MERRLKIIYKKNLKMSTGKIAAQCVHAAAGLTHTDKVMSVVVLGVSDKKYHELLSTTQDFYAAIDAGYTEVKPGTETCAAYYEDV